MQSHILILAFTCYLIEATFTCFFCELDLLGEKPNIGFSWKIPPSSWNGPILAFQSMDFTTYIKSENKYSLVLQSGYDDNKNFADNIVSINITFDPSTNSTFTSTQISNSDDPLPSFGHSFTHFPGYKKDTSESKGIFMYGGVRATSIVPNATLILLQRSEYFISSDPNNVIKVTALNVQGLLPPTRAFHSAVWTNYYSANLNYNQSLGHIIIFGGIGNNIVLNDVWVFNIENRTWNYISTPILQPSTRSRHLAATWGSQMVIFGGFSEKNEPLGDLWILDLATNTWSNPIAKGPIPSPRYDSTAKVITGGKMFIFGGRSINDIYGDVFEYDIVNNYWNQLCYIRSKNDVIPRFAHASILVGPNQVLIYGGITFNNVWISDLRIYDKDVYRTSVYCDLTLSCIDRNLCLSLQNNLLLTSNCSPENPFPCYSKYDTQTIGCSDSLGNCVGGTCDVQEPYKCWNGLCVTSPSLCAPLTFRCPVGQQRCSNGTCAIYCGEPLPEICGPICETNITYTSCIPNCNNTNQLPCCNINSTDCCVNLTRECNSWEKVSQNYCLGTYGWSCEGLRTDGQAYAGCQSFDGCPSPLYQCGDGSCAPSVEECKNNTPSSCYSDAPYACAFGFCVTSPFKCPFLPPYWPRLNIISKTVEKIPQFISLSSNSVVKSIIQISPKNLLQFTYSVLPSPSESDLQQYTSYDGWALFYRGVSGRAEYFANIFSPIHNLSFSNTVQINEEVSLYFVIIEGTNLDNDNLCIGYLNSFQKWDCLETNFPQYINYSNNMFVGGKLSQNGFHVRSDSYIGTIALIRKNWPRPTAKQIINDINKTFTKQTWEKILKNPILDYAALNDTTLLFIFDDPPLENNIRDNTLQSLQYYYGVTDDRILFIFYFGTFQKRKTELLYSYLLTILDNSPPTITPPLTPNPEPIAPTPGDSVINNDGLSQEVKFLIAGVVCAIVILICFALIIIKFCCDCNFKKEREKTILPKRKKSYGDIDSKNKLNSRLLKEGTSPPVSPRTSLPNRKAGVSLRHASATFSQSTFVGPKYSVDMDATITHGCVFDPKLMDNDKNKLLYCEDDIDTEGNGVPLPIIRNKTNESNFRHSIEPDTSAADTGTRDNSIADVGLPQIPILSQSSFEEMTQEEDDENRKLSERLSRSFNTILNINKT